MPEAVAGWHGGEPPRILPGLELLPGVVRCFGFPVIQQSHLGGCAPALHLRLLSACGYSAAGGFSLYFLLRYSSFPKQKSIIPSMIFL